MRVLLTTDTVGGVWTFTRELVTEFLSRGHSVVLISLGRHPSPSQAAWAKATAQNFGSSFTYTSSNVPLEWMPDNAFAYSAAVSLLENSIDEFSPNLLHFNQFCFGAFPNPLPRLITAHSDVLSWAAACRPGGLEPSNWLTRYIDLVRAGLSGADAVCTPTHWMAAQLRCYFPFGPEPHTILNGRTLTNAPNPPQRKLQAVSAGRLWDEAKNIAMLSQVTSALPILVAGEQGFGEAQAPTKPAGWNLAFTGALSEDALLNLFRQSSVYIAPSVYEPFGLAPLEAALCGCAVLANDIDSLREVWGDNALYFHDAPELEALLRQLAADPARLHAAQQRSLARAEELSAPRMADAYLALYQRLLDRAQPAPLSEPATVSLQENVTHAV